MRKLQASLQKFSLTTVLTGVVLIAVFPLLHFVITKSIQLHQFELIHQLKKKDAQLIHFTFTESEFARIVLENGKELFWNGKQYDCYSIERKDNKVRVTCLLDQKETRLNKLVSLLKPMHQAINSNSTFNQYLPLYAQNFKEMQLVRLQAIAFEYPYCIIYPTSNHCSVNAPPPKA